jgi:hypothetical protein
VTTEPTSSPESAEPLKQALAQTQQVQAKLNSGAQELFVISEVLKQEVPPEVRIGDVAQAIEKHEALEDTVQGCADDLEDVSQALAREVARRKRLEKKLSQAHADLADTEADLAAAQRAKEPND